MKLEHLLLLLLGGAICSVPLRLRDGVPGVRRERELEVIPQVEPPLVPATVRAGQHHRDVVVPAALLRLKIGAADCRHAGAVPQAGEPEEVLEHVLLSANAEVPLAHRFEGGHLLDAVRV
jgi:hypothetical protein